MSKEKEPKKSDDIYYTGSSKFSPIPLSVSSPVIKPENMGQVRANAVEVMHKQAQQQIEMLKKQAEVIMQQVREIEERVKISYDIYEAEMKFTPHIHNIYYLYEKNEKRILSFISPEEWGSKMPYERMVAKVRLLPDKTWEVL